VDRLTANHLRSSWSEARVLHGAGGASEMGAARELEEETAGGHAVRKADQFPTHAGP
jgi:hypothetical protein